MKSSLVLDNGITRSLEVAFNILIFLHIKH